MKYRLAAAAFTGAAIVAAGAGAAHATDAAYPPAQPDGVMRSIPAQHAPSHIDASPQPTAETVGAMTIPTTTNDSALPTTGAEWAVTATVGAGLLVGGSALVVAARRRTTV